MPESGMAGGTMPFLHTSEADDKFRTASNAEGNLSFAAAKMIRSCRAGYISFDTATMIRSCQAGYIS